MRIAIACWLLITVILGTSSIAAADTLMGTSGSYCCNTGVFNPSTVKAMDFTLTGSATNVSISVNIGSLPGSTPGTVNAYLVQALGSTSPPIVQAAVVPVNAADGTAGMTTLFYGLSLPAGKYFLLLYDFTSTDYWQVASNLVLGDGTTTSSNVWRAVAPTSPVWSTSLSSTPVSSGLGVGYSLTVIGSPGVIPFAPATYPALQICGSDPQESQLYNLREQVGTNDAGVAPGDIIQAGSYCVIDTALGNCATVGASSDLTGTVTLAGTGYPLVNANDATNPNHQLHYIPVSNSSPPAGPAQMAVTLNGTSITTACDTPPLTDTNGVVAPVVAYAQGLAFTTTNGVLVPTISFTEPTTFLNAAASATGGGALRFQIWDLQPASGGTPLVIYAANNGFSPSFSSSTSSYSINVPSMWTTNSTSYSLLLNHPYAVEIQSALLRQSGSGYGTGNANVVSRSRVFADYTPLTLPAGIQQVSLPTTNPTGSASGSTQYTFAAPVPAAGTPIYVETPAFSSNTLTFTIGSGNPSFYAVVVPAGSALDGASVYVPGSGGSYVPAGMLQNGAPVIFSSPGVSSFELVLPGAIPANSAGIRSAAPGLSSFASSGGTSTAALIGLSFTAPTTFTGTVTPGAAQLASTNAGTTDGPLPLWALGALGAGLVGIASRRLKRAA